VSPPRIAPLLFAVAAFAFYSGSDATAKVLSRDYPLSMIIACVSGFALLPISWMVMRSGGVRVLRIQNKKLHVARAVLVLCNISCGFTSYRLLPLADAYAIAFSAPFFITIGSTLFLGEPVGWRRWSAIVVGFIGVLIALKPDESALSYGALAAVGSALSYSMSSLVLRHMRLSETRESTIFYPSLFVATVACIIAGESWLTMRTVDLPLFVLAGVLNGTAQLCFTIAIRNAPAASVAPFQYTQLLWGSLYGMALFGDVPGWSVLVGGAIVIGSGLYVFHREAVRGGNLTSVPT
jgi:drug/metabolite transporter (DMT)-like permease